jgi:hypothetical protein
MEADLIMSCRRRGVPLKYSLTFFLADKSN